MCLIIYGIETKYFSALRTFVLSLQLTSTVAKFYFLCLIITHYMSGFLYLPYTPSINVLVYLFKLYITLFTETSTFLKTTRNGTLSEIVFFQKKLYFKNQCFIFFLYTVSTAHTDKINYKANRK